MGCSLISGTTIGVIKRETIKTMAHLLRILLFLNILNCTHFAEPRDDGNHAHAGFQSSTNAGRNDFVDPSTHPCFAGLCTYLIAYHGILEYSII